MYLITVRIKNTLKCSEQRRFLPTHSLFKKRKKKKIVSVPHGKSIQQEMKTRGGKTKKREKKTHHAMQLRRDINVFTSDTSTEAEKYSRFEGNVNRRAQFSRIRWVRETFFEGKRKLHGWRGVDYTHGFN